MAGGRPTRPRGLPGPGAVGRHDGPVSAEDLESYENELELSLYREYRDVASLFSYVVETERRFYLCNAVDLKVRTEGGERFRARYLISGMGALSHPTRPGIPGADSFSGESYHTARWPQDGSVELAGKRVGVIGLGASGVQIVPVVADVADELVVFQRTPNYVVASSNREVDEQWMRQVRENYDENFRKARDHVFAVPFEKPGQSAKEVSPQERERVFEQGWRDGGFHFMLETFHDLAVDPESGEHASEFVRRKIHETVQDPDTAELLSPRDYPFNGKRPPGGHGYYESYNRDNVRLVDVKTHGIDDITPEGVRVGGVLHELDVLIFATGFDAMTGTLTQIDVVGRDGVVLRDKWSEALRTNLGLAVHGFPNFFMILGPQTPYANLPVAIEAGVQWVSEAIAHVERHGARRIESTPEAEREWADEVNEAGAGTLMARGANANAWFVETSEPGKPIEFNVFMGGADVYFRRCDEVADNGYPGFVISQS